MSLSGSSKLTTPSPSAASNIPLDCSPLNYAGAKLTKTAIFFPNKSLCS